VRGYANLDEEFQMLQILREVVKGLNSSPGTAVILYIGFSNFFFTFYEP
jgi:hypothetical protein